MPSQRKTRRKPRTKRRSKGGPSVRFRGSEASAGEWFEKLVALQSRLRAPGGCPWDREQTHDSLRRFLIEETYEVLDALESGDSREFASELGDLLLQVVFHSILAEEAGRFTIADVIEAIHTKMVRRHPHVFEDVKAATSAEVLKNWEQLKAEERAADGKRSKQEESGSILDGVSGSQPAVLEAKQLTRRAAKIGFDWDDVQGIFEKMDEEKREILSAMKSSHRRSDEASASWGTKREKIEEEAGDLLFAVVNVARFLDVDPEIALKRANRKFRERIASMEAAAQRQGRQLADLPREQMEKLWDESKSSKEPRMQR
ncbi:MAG TPA: nucleoside triphosphate pyrophosphohydrolase [Candidatus Acidoferrum sp.]|nr:nucleoside triphosphate pyrophosphohydrolase [Candidatus Acidoferrum sp.]